MVHDEEYWRENWPPDGTVFNERDLIGLYEEYLETVIYIDGNRFNQCEHLSLAITTEETIYLDEINSIDEVGEKMNLKRHYRSNLIMPEEEFWGYCSNIQTWFENGYNTSLLHRNIAFPLLKELTIAGDPIAKKMFKNEIKERFERGY